MGGKMIKKLSMSLLLIAIVIVNTKADEQSTKDEKAIAEAKVDFTDGIEMQIKKVTGADGKEVSILIKKEVLPDSMVPPATPKRKRREVADNVLDLEKLKNDKNFKKEKIKDADGNEVEVYVLDVLEDENRGRKGRFRKSK